MKKVLQIFSMLVVFSCFFIVSFHLPTRKLIAVYTYYGFYALIILCVCLTVLLWILVKKHILKFDYKDCIIVILLCFFCNAFFFGMVPVTMERSISVFMISEMDKAGQMSKDEIEANFINKYVKEYDAFHKRLEEQIYINNINENEDEYTLSKSGRFMLKCFQLINKMYHVESNLLD